MRGARLAEMIAAAHIAPRKRKADAAEPRRRRPSASSKKRQRSAVKQTRGKVKFD